MKILKLGSLFDGIGGFPYAGSKFGIEPVWASEIESWPIKVTQKHFPKMKHLGDISKIDGSQIEPVDIITFGSPCQDLSVAGKRAGLEGERSGLFAQAIRIIKEMREKTNGIYPRFAVWENVPGALSSNSGRDFIEVLWSFVEIGAIDICWRILDAQFFGVPQRRRRIFFVADFTGECAEQILFESKGLRGDFEKGRETGKEVAETVGSGIKAAGFKYGNSASARSIGWELEKCPTLCGGEGGNQKPCVLFDMTHADEGMRPVTEGLAPTLNSRMGTGGNQVPVLLGTIQNATRGKSQNGLGISQDDVSYTLDSLGNHAVATVDCRNLCENENLSATLQSKTGGGYSLNYQNPVRIGYAVRRLTPLECLRLQGFPDNWLDIDGMADTQKYKAVGNSVAIPCVEFVLSRMALCFEP